MDLTDEQELQLMAMVYNQGPCEWTKWARRFEILCDTICPVRRMVTEDFLTHLREQKHQEYEKEYPDG